MSRKQIGNFYETVAVVDAKRRGIRIIDRNLYTRYGEIDILGKSGDTLVVIEVRGRATGEYPPHRFISSAKLSRLRTLALWASAQHQRSVRIELIEIIGPKPDGLKERLAVIAPQRFGLKIFRFPISTN